jgi:hypothetical protein
MHQLKVDVGTRILLVACVGYYLPFSIPHPLRDTTYTIFDIVPEKYAKILGSKGVLKTTLV